MKLRVMRSIIAAALGCLALASCGSPAAKAKAEAEAARRAEALGRLEAAKSRLAVAGADDGARTEALRAVLQIEVMELGDLDAAFALFEKDGKLLAGDRQARVFLAVAQSMQAGREKKIEDKLAWLRKGMNSFDALGEDYPNDELVLLYQASTYASFPPEVGAKAETLDIIDRMRASYASGAWKPSEGNARQLAWTYATLSKNYPDSRSAAEIVASRAGLARALPAFAAVVGGSGSDGWPRP